MPLHYVDPTEEYGRWYRTWSASAARVREGSWPVTSSGTSIRGCTA